VVELIPENYFAPLDLEKIYGRVAPLQVDLGCGDGFFLAALAERSPEKDFLGTEKLLARSRKAFRKSAHLTNVRVMRIETSYAVRYLLPKNSVEMFHLMFPDPWEKRKHHQRRVMSEEFLNAMRDALIENGTIRIVTDHADYFEEIRRVADSSSDFAARDLKGIDDFPSSTFENKFKDAGLEIYRLELRKTSPVT
jgi:tRNA (guanine-N7-)-methyltransferase